MPIGMTCAVEGGNIQCYFTNFGRSQYFTNHNTFCRLSAWSCNWGWRFLSLSLPA